MPPRGGRPSAREEAFLELERACRAAGFPADLASALEAQLGTEMTMRRMAGYLRSANPRSIEEVVDEALAIAAQRDTWVERKKRDYANEKLNEFYNRERNEG